MATGAPMSRATMSSPLVVEAPGYQPNSQKITLPEGVVKELEVKLKPAAPKPIAPAGKTSAKNPPDDIVPSPWTVVKFFINGETVSPEALTYTGRVTDRLTGKPIAGATVTVLRRVSSRTRPSRSGRSWAKPSIRPTPRAGTRLRCRQTKPPKKNLYIEITVEHPNYVRYYGGYSFDMIRKNEKLGERPFFENIHLWSRRRRFSGLS